MGFLLLEASSDRAFLLVQKSIAGEVVQGSNVTVTLSVYNAGSEAARDVVLRDEWPEESFDLVSGKYEENYESIAPSANVTNTFIVTPTVDGEFESARASVEYKYGTGDNAQETEGYSS